MDALPNAEAAAPVLPSVVRVGRGTRLSETVRTSCRPGTSPGLASSDHDVDGCPLGEEGLLQVSMLLHLYLRGRGPLPRDRGKLRPVLWDAWTVLVTARSLGSLHPCSIVGSLRQIA